MCGRVTDALLDAAGRDDLLVIGGPASYGRRASRLGCIGMQLIAQAPCPVEIASWLVGSALSDDRSKHMFADPVCYFVRARRRAHAEIERDIAAIASHPRG